MASIIERIGSGCASNPMRVLISLTAPFNGILRQELLNTEWFHSVKQAQVAINIWLKEYNHIRPHHALGMRPPVPETLLEKRKIYGTEIGG
ncbi:transposase [Planktomarina temperata]|nr:transposase [Planktomarina temperata]